MSSISSHLLCFLISAAKSACGLVIAATFLLAHHMLFSPKHSNVEIHSSIHMPSEAYNEPLTHHRKRTEFFSARGTLFNLYKQTNDSVITAASLFREIRRINYLSNKRLNLRDSREFLVCMCVLGAVSTLMWQIFAPQMFNVSYSGCVMPRDRLREQLRKGAFNQLTTAVARTGDPVSFSGALSDDTLMGSYDIKVPRARIAPDSKPSPLSISAPDFYCNKSCNMIAHITRDDVELPWALNMYESESFVNVSKPAWYDLSLYEAMFPGLSDDERCNRHSLLYNRSISVVANGADRHLLSSCNGVGTKIETF